MLSAKERRLLEALEPLATAHNVEIVTVEVVGFDELAASQKWVNELMDELDPFPGAYTLEVSSPGIDRPLRTPEHFQRFAGEKVQLTLTQPHQGRAKWTGKLCGMRDEDVLVEVDGIQEALPYAHIKKAHIIGTIDFSG